ncbi:MAG: hypothetical protein ACTHYD_06010 [Canibacter sp.]
MPLTLGLPASSPRRLVERHSRCGRHVQRVDAATHRDRDPAIEQCVGLRRDAVALQLTQRASPTND